MREWFRRERFGRSPSRLLGLGLALFLASCGVPFVGSGSDTPDPGPCQVEVWNDNSVTIHAWYGASREDLGTLPPHQSVVLSVSCRNERITFGGTELEGDREATPIVVDLEAGETKLAQLRLAG